MRFTNRVKFTGLAALVVGATTSLFAVGRQETPTLGISRNGFVQDTAQQEPKYSVRLDGQTIAFEVKDNKIVDGDRSEDHEIFNGTLEDIKENYLFFIARGIIPDVRHFNPRVKEIAQLMSRDRNYLSNPYNGFEFLALDYWSPKNTNWKQQGIDGLPLAYARRNIFIGGVYYDLTILLVGNQLNEKSVEIKDLFEITINRSEEGNKEVRIDYALEVRPGQNYERYMERRQLSTGKRLFIEAELSGDASTLSKREESLIYMLDFGGIIQPLIEAVKKQVVFFDKDWNP